MIAPVLAALLLGASPGGAQDIAISITVSGGVSLGAYEAGFLYYTLAAQRANRGSRGCSSPPAPRRGA